MKDINEIDALRRLTSEELEGDDLMINSVGTPGNTRCVVGSTFCLNKEPFENSSSMPIITGGVVRQIPSPNGLGEFSSISAETDSVEKTADSLPEHLRDLFKNSVVNRTTQEQKEIWLLLNNFQDIFSRHDMDLGLTSLTEHVIDTEDTRQTKQAPRRPPRTLIEEEKKSIDKLLKQGIIQRSSSPWSSPLCLVKKKNGKIRMCVDYRRLNIVTRKDAYPLSKSLGCMDALRECMFSALDLTSCYLVIIRCQ
jgi:hypothetical protein